MKETLTALIREGEEPDSHVVLAPAVGRYSSPPPVGTYLEPGSHAGVLRVLRKSYRLVVPRGVRGIVRETPGNHLGEMVEYGQPLIVTARSALPVEGEAAERSKDAEDGDDGVPEGAVAVRSPT
ncbi:MAG: hypothetical protein ACYTDY_12060, partial [Planctomycetota bacterium]